MVLIPFAILPQILAGNRIQWICRFVNRLLNFDYDYYAVSWDLSVTQCLCSLSIEIHVVFTMHTFNKQNSGKSTLNLFYQPATHEAHGRLILRLLCGFRICWYIYIYMYVRTYHMRNNYVTYIAVTLL